jgi:hypothetical protein
MNFSFHWAKNFVANHPWRALKRGLVLQIT